MTSQALTAFDQPAFVSELHVLAKFHPKCTPATCAGSEASQKLLLLAANSGNAPGSVWTYKHCPYSKRLQMSLTGVPFMYLKSFQALMVEPSFSPCARGTLANHITALAIPMLSKHIVAL